MDWPWGADKSRTAEGAIHDDEFLVEGSVGSAPEGSLDACLGESVGEVGVGSAHGGGGGGAVFGEDDDFDAGGGFFAQGCVEVLDGACAAVVEVVGRNPDGVGGGADGVEDGFAKGFGGEEADVGGIGGFGKMAGGGIQRPFCRQRGPHVGEWTT
jgi:hypothetical protein